VNRLYEIADSVEPATEKAAASWKIYMPYRQLPAGESYSETCPQLGYMGYNQF